MILSAFNTKDNRMYSFLNLPLFYRNTEICSETFRAFTHSLSSLPRRDQEANLHVGTLVGHMGLCILHFKLYYPTNEARNKALIGRENVLFSLSMEIDLDDWVKALQTYGGV
jgi:hypothetical protein